VGFPMGRDFIQKPEESLWIG